MTMPTTCLILLSRLGRDDPAAWSAFVRRYGPTVLLWCRARGLQEADAEDVAQEILARLARRIDRFDLDRSGRFRGWLMAMARAILADWRAIRRRVGQGVEPGADPDGVPGPDVLAEWIEAEHERERFEVAAERVRARVAPRTFEAFRLMSLAGVKGPEVADRLGMSLCSVHQARSRVLRAVRAEVEKLEACG